MGESNHEEGRIKGFPRGFFQILLNKEQKTGTNITVYSYIVILGLTNIILKFIIPIYLKGVCCEEEVVND